MHFSKVKHSGISVEQIGQETLVYDERHHKAYCLNPVASAIWRLADGSRSADQIAAAATFELSAGVTTLAVETALGQFRADDLLDQTQVVSTGILPDASRRDAIRKVGFGAAMLVPVIAAVMAPKAAQAYNGCVNCAPTSSARAQAKKNQAQNGLAPAPAPENTPKDPRADGKQEDDEPRQEYEPR